MNTPIDVKVPVENVNDQTARLLTCSAKPGIAVVAGTVIAELETTKTTFDLLAPVAGEVEYLWIVGDEVPVGEVLCRIHPDGVGVLGRNEQSAELLEALSPPPAKAKETPPAAEPVMKVPPATDAPAVSPPAPRPDPQVSISEPMLSVKASELAKKHGVEPGAFAGKAFVRESDIRLRVGMPQTGVKLRDVDRPKASVKVAAPTPPLPSYPLLDGDIVPLERAKLYENRELLLADRSVLKSTLHFHCPAPGLQKLCAGQTPSIQRLVVILYETSKLLATYRQLNSCLVNDSGYQYKDVNIGFAVDIERGLKVLVIRAAQNLSFQDLAARFEELLVRYSTNTLQVSDLTGGTFTVTDLSGEGVHAFDPLINVNQAAILGVGTDHPGASRADGFMLSCAFDHRLFGGRIVAGFLGELSRRLVAHAASLQTADADAEAPHCCRCLMPATDIRKMDNMLIPSTEPAGHICSICFSGY